MAVLYFIHRRIYFYNLLKNFIFVQDKNKKRRTRKYLSISTRLKFTDNQQRFNEILHFNEVLFFHSIIPG